MRIVKYIAFKRLLMPAMAFVFLLGGVACKSKKEAEQSADPIKQTGKKKTLLGVEVTAIALDKFPRYDQSGEKWDSFALLSEDPDVFLTMKWKETVLYKSEVYQDCLFGVPVQFTKSLPTPIKPFDQSILIEIFDEDGLTAHDNMGYFVVTLANYKDLKKVVLKSSDDQLQITLSLNWKYE